MEMPSVHNFVEIAGEGFPIGLDAMTFAMLDAVLLEDRAFQGCHRLAFADDVQRHTLTDFALGIAVGDQRLIAMGMHVDVTRGNHQTLRRDRPRAGFGANLADTGDPAIFDRDIAVNPRVARAVDDSAAMNYNIELSHGISFIRA